MASYALTIKRSAAKELDGLDIQVFTRIDRKIQALANNPRPAGCAKLQGYSDLWRIRIGDYRVIYAVDVRQHGGHRPRRTSPGGL